MPKRVTVWVHGTRGNAFLPLGISRTMTETEHTFCYCPPGFHPVQLVDQSLHQRKLVDLLNATDPDQFPAQHSYLFGWSGLANNKDRRLAAQELYKELYALSERYRLAYGVPPHITLIAHSHGGNVVLNLARFADQQSPFIIAQAILLGTPVQKETATLAEHDIFSTVYLLHSHVDIFQVIDAQKVQMLRSDIAQWWSQKEWATCKNLLSNLWHVPLFSQRHLAPHKKVVQANITWSDVAPWTDQDFIYFGYYENFMRWFVPKCAQQMGRGILHTEFILPLFIKRFPALLKNLSQTTLVAQQTAPDTVEHCVQLT